ncbi:MAG: FecR domain-containing protein [Ardenticatenaceae bacterium]
MSSEPTPREISARWISRERMAWTVLIVAFAVFVVLAVTIPLAIGWYVQNASVAQLANIQGTRGVTLVESANPRLDVVGAVEVGRAEAVVEGGVLRVDPASQASVVFFDRSTLTLFPNSTVTLDIMRKPRFARSERPNQIVVTLHSGRVRAQIAPAGDPAIHFEIHTPQTLAPQGGILLQPGSYAIETSNEMSHISVRMGTALVNGQTGQQTRLQANERAEIALGAAAVGPLPAKRNLVVNSDFQNPEEAAPISAGHLVAGWFALSDQGGDGGSVDGTVEVVTTGTSRALHLYREGSNNNHGETGVIQKVDKLVGDYLSLLLRLDVELVNQSLSGGGEQSSEFPLIVRVDYTDGNGNPQHWTHGFYYHNTAGYNIRDGEQIPQNARYSYEVDLKEVLSDPQRINTIEIYASGWDWDAYASGVELIAE